MLESFASQIVIRVIFCARQLSSHFREFCCKFLGTCQIQRATLQLQVQVRLSVAMIKIIVHVSCTRRTTYYLNLVTVLVGYMARSLYSSAFSFRPFLYSCPLEFVYFYSYQSYLLCVRCAEGSASRFLVTNWNWLLELVFQLQFIG